MAGAREKAIQEEIEKAVAWYCKEYNKTSKDIEVHQRYDRVEKHLSWRILVRFRQEDWVLPIGISTSTMEGPKFFQIKSRLCQFIKNSLMKAQRKYEPLWLPGIYGPEKVT